MNIAIIGCGTQGTRYAEVAAQAGHTISVCADIVQTRARKLARCYEAKPTTQAGDVFRRKTVDAVIIASAPKAHSAHLGSAVRARKHLLCVSPLTSLYRQGRTLSAAIRKAGVTAHIALPADTSPHLHATHNQIAQGKIGSVGFIRIQRAVPRVSKKGCIILEALLPEFDWISTQFGPIEKVFCHLLNRPRLQFAAATLTLQSKTLVQAIATTSDSPRTQLEICGTTGMICFDSDQTPLRANSRTSIVIDTNPRASSPERTHFQNFICALDQPNDTIVRAMQACRIAEVAQKSADTGAAVKL